MAQTKPPASGAPSAGEGAVRTVCPYCGVGCGLLVRTERGRVTAIEGDPEYPVNRGRTCRKPLELPSAVHAGDRATHPLWRDRRDARFRTASWDDALGTVAARLRAIVDEHGPEAIAFYISGQLLTEDYYAVNKLAKGFLGTNNVDSNSRLCMSSAVAGYVGAFGSDGPPPSYADIEAADCLLLLGTNTAACHPIVWSRIRDRQAEGAFVICADPRRTATAEASDLHLPVRPGTDLVLLNAMLCLLDDEGLTDTDFIARHTSGFEETLAAAREWPPERAEGVCGVSAVDIATAARRFGAERGLALWSMGANQSTVGTHKNRAVINLCLASGQIGKPGSGPLSLTGQPNAMGGRETGGACQLLPGYRRVDSPEDRAAVEGHWGVPGAISPEPGLPAVDLFDALEGGRVKAVWVVATNPAVSMPDATRARAALERAELLVVQDAYHPTETSALAHAVLPAAAWPEKAGTMTNSERRVAPVRPALDPPGEALPDWRVFARLAAELGWAEHFAWPDAAAVFEELAALTAGRVCDMSGVDRALLEREGSVQWPRPADAARASDRLYPDHRYPTPDGRARFEPTPHRAPAERAGGDYPLVLTTGRVAHHWHTLTRTGKSATLTASDPEPFVEVHPLDADAAGLAHGESVRIVSRRGQVTVSARVEDSVPRGVVFSPFHWGALHAPPGAGATNAATHGAADPFSHQPELKAAAVRLETAAGAPTDLEARVRAAGALSCPAPVARNGERRSAAGNGERRSAARSSSPQSPARPRVVVVGTGMAGLRVAEEIVTRAPGHALVTMLGEEPSPTYNRILLSRVLARTAELADIELRPESWYAELDIDLRTGVRAVAADLERRRVVDADGIEHPYDALVLATGSRPFVPPIGGADQPHVYSFRTTEDALAIAAAAEDARRAVVVGGGLLGLEAAAGLLRRGVEVTVVEVSDRLMAQQLDHGGAAMLRRELEALGLRALPGRSVTRILRAGVVLNGAEDLPADLVVIAAGVRPEVSLAREAGLETRRGILVDDELRASAPRVWAVGECAEHRGTVYGLWAPLAEQARVAGASVLGEPAGFTGATVATTLKIAGVELFVGGAKEPADDGEEVVLSDTRRSLYRKLVLDGDRLTGAIVVNEPGVARRAVELLRTGDPLQPALLEPGADGDAEDADDPDAIVCSCNRVTRSELEEAIASSGLESVAEVAEATKATTGCGSCTGEVEELIANGSSGGNTGVKELKLEAAKVEA
ncbi:MAG TPA: molybdopterin-dependent oxidoreductase [Thermoleophilaceae bacterium]|nr:molybdopterin-dependent oxidoreductase [Thermoleophilaceae bacterium]